MKKILTILLLFISMYSFGIEATISISASSTTVCDGTTVTFTATITNGGASPIYQWKVNGSNVGTGATSYSYAPSNNDAIVCVLTSSDPLVTNSPVTSNTITMTVNPNLSVGVSISTPSTSICTGSLVTCTANPVNGGVSPSYQWRKNGINVGTNSQTYSFTPLDGDAVLCIVTSSIDCPTGSPATSGVLTFDVFSSVSPSVSISPSPNDSVCESTAVLLTAYPVNGGVYPTYQWKKNGSNVSGATNSTYQLTPIENDSVRVVMTSSLLCVTENNVSSNKVTLKVLSCITASVSISASSYAVVSGTPVTYTASIVNGGDTPMYQWYNDGDAVSGATNSTMTLTPTNNNNITCVLTSSDPLVSNNPVTSNTINMIVYTTGTSCTGTPTVLYGGKTYNTVEIGTQCWLRENISIGTTILNNVTQTNNATIERYCYNNDTNMCNIYGGLYQWAEVVQYYNGVTNTTHWNPVPTTNIQGICPAGWHIPKKTEYETLMNYLQPDEAGKIKEAGNIHWSGPNAGANNSSGFTALPHGGSSYAWFSCLQYYGCTWTVTKGTQNSAVYVFGAAYNFDEYVAGQTEKIFAYPVRCIKD